MSSTIISVNYSRLWLSRYIFITAIKIHDLSYWPNLIFLFLFEELLGRVKNLSAFLFISNFYTFAESRQNLLDLIFSVIKSLSDMGQFNVDKLILKFPEYSV